MLPILLLLSANFIVYALYPAPISFDITTAFQLAFVALCEELFFRGLVLDQLIRKNWFSKSNTTLLVSVIFSLLHIVNLYSYATASYVAAQLVFALGASMVLCHLYLKQGLLPCIVLHIVINLSSLLCESTNISSLPPLAMAIYLAVGLIAIIHEI